MNPEQQYAILTIALFAAFAAAGAALLRNISNSSAASLARPPAISAARPPAWHFPSSPLTRWGSSPNAIMQAAAWMNMQVLRDSFQRLLGPAKQMRRNICRKSDSRRARLTWAGSWL